MSALHDIRVKPTTYNRLVKHGKFGESYNDLIKKILAVIENKQETLGVSKQ